MRKKRQDEMYYIQDTRQYVGNAILWWGIDGGGYTCDITKAGKYTYEQAKRICERKTDRAWACSYIDKNAKAHVIIIDMQFVDSNEYSKRFPETKIFNHD